MGFSHVLVNKRVEMIHFCTFTHTESYIYLYKNGTMYLAIDIGK